MEPKVFRVKIPVAESDQQGHIVAPFQGANFSDRLTWGFAETASPQALLSVAFGDEEIQSASVP